MVIHYPDPGWAVLDRDKPYGCVNGVGSRGATLRPVLALNTSSGELTVRACCAGRYDCASLFDDGRRRLLGILRGSERLLWPERPSVLRLELDFCVL